MSLNPLRATFFRGNTYIYLRFMSFLHIDIIQVVEILPQVWQDLNLFYIINIMGADVLATQGARASATMIFTMLNQINSVPTHEALNPWVSMVTLFSMVRQTEEGQRWADSKNGNTTGVLIHCGPMMPCQYKYDRPGSTKPLPDPILAYHQWGPVRFIWGQFHKRYHGHQSLK